MKTSLFFNSREIEYPKGKFDLYSKMLDKYFDNASNCNLDTPEKQAQFLSELSQVISDNDFDIKNKLNFIASLMEIVNFGSIFYSPDSK